MIDLKIYNNIHAENPRTARDCQPPLITKWWRNFGDAEYWIDIIQFVRWKLNKKNMYSIAEVLWYSKEEVKSRIDRYSYYNWYSVIEDLVCEVSDIEDIESILDILKVKNYRWTSRWYSQWDVIDCILVATDDRVVSTGIKNKDIMQSLKNSAKLYNARAWWDVYWYRVIQYNDIYDKNWQLSLQKEDEIIDSCRWFYWDDWLQQIFDETKIHWITEDIFEKAKENIIY